MLKHKNASFPTLTLLALVYAPHGFAQDAKALPQFEFHSYGRLGISTSETLVDAGRDQGDGAFGLPTSRHVRDLNYLRIQMQGRAAQNSLFNIEGQFDNLAHQTKKWDGAGLNLRNAYFQMPISEDSAVWAGARRLEFEDVRLFDRFPLSDTTFYGAGASLPVAGSPATIAVGFKNLDNDKLEVANDSNNPAAGNTSIATTRRDTSLFLRHDISLGSNLAVRPTLILNRTGQYVRDGVSLNKYDTAVTQTNSINTNETPKPIVTGKVGAVLSHWGDTGWGNHFAWVEQRVAQGQTSGSDKDTIVGLATSGDYEGWASENFGLMYSAMYEQTFFKIAQPKYVLKGNEYEAHATTKSKNNTVLAVGVQPVYYATDKLHVALDFSHTYTNKVGVASKKPNMTFITPIVRYAANKNALATPQLFTSVTFGHYESKARRTTGGTATNSSVTTQTGCEFWF
jgi:hypothetical protein